MGGHFLAFLEFVASTKTHGRKTPEQAHLALFSTIDLPLPAFGPQFGLRWPRQLVDARHAARPVERAFRCWRDERPRPRGPNRRQRHVLRAKRPFARAPPASHV